MPKSRLNKAVFLDRDGTLVEQTHLSVSASELTVDPYAVESIRRFRQLGFKVFVVTNQPQVARGLCRESDILQIHEFLSDKLASEGAIVDRFYFCPHHPEQRSDIPDWAQEYRIECNCRKPHVGMLESAAKDFDLDIASSYMIGDRTVDIQTAKNIGCRSILVETGECGKDGKYAATADKVCKNLMDAADHIEASQIGDITAVILAGGLGTRFKSVTADLAKSMITIKGKPAIEYQVEFLQRSGIKKIVICSGYLSEQLERYFKSQDKYAGIVEFSREEEPLGTGGAIHHAQKHLESAEQVLVLNGDLWIDFPIKDLIYQHFESQSDVTLTVRETDHPEDSDILRLSGRRVVEYLGRGQSNEKTANTGIVLFRKNFLEAFKKGKSNFEKDVVFPRLATHEIQAYQLTQGIVKDYGTQDRFNKLMRELEMKQ